MDHSLITDPSAYSSDMDCSRDTESSYTSFSSCSTDSSMSADLASEHTGRF